MSQLKTGTLIYDSEDDEWGIITGLVDEETNNTYYSTSWSKSIDQVLIDFDLDLDRFEVYEV